MAYVLILIYNEKNGSSDRFNITYLVNGKVETEPEPMPLSIVYAVF